MRGLEQNEVDMNRTTLLLALPLLVASAVPALAFGTDSTPYDPSVQSQFSDPDEAIDNLADPSGGHGTALSVQTDGSGSAGTGVAVPAASPADAEPVNPAWPMWMTWHQQ
jgi:hypothetical protein